MSRFFRSTKTEPHARGIEFGSTHREQVQTNISTYINLFKLRGAIDSQLLKAGNDALHVTKSYAPPLFEEMLGLAEGAGVNPALIGMLNARTEILALIKAKTRGECSVVIHVPHDASPPIAIQTWDWFYALRDSWLVWEIPLADGSTTKTMTEYGIVGKAGLNTRGLGLLFTILHHINDGQCMGVPVHIAARWALDKPRNIAQAAQQLAAADVSASSSINLVSHEAGISTAMTVELHPGGPGFVLPNERGILVHTNHFLAQGLSAFDTEPKAFPDTLLRHNLLQRRLSAMQNVTAKNLVSAMSSHSGGDSAVCCHHNSETPNSIQYETLSTVVLDVASGTLQVHQGGPCTFPLSQLRS